MITLLKRFFIDNWQRKLLALILAMIIWIVVNHYMSLSTTIRNVPVRVKNIPKGQTVEGVQDNGILNRKISLNVHGNKDVIQSLEGKDLEVVIDAESTSGEWKASIDKKNVFVFNKRADYRSITHVDASDIHLVTAPMITEKVPVFVSKPIGDPPKGYEFLDILPYKFSLNVTGPQSTVKKLQKEGVKLTFNLDHISRDELDRLYEKKGSTEDAISYLIPQSLKKVHIPSLSKYPFEIDDIQAENLRVNFVKRELIRIQSPLPISFFLSHKLTGNQKHQQYTIKNNKFVEVKNGISIIKTPLYAKGVSPLFAEITKDLIQIVISLSPEGKKLSWSVQIMNPHSLEDAYVEKKLSLFHGKTSLHKYKDDREEHLRNRFRKYVNQLRLFTSNNEKLSLDIRLENNQIVIEPRNKF